MDIHTDACLVACICVYIYVGMSVHWSKLANT